MHYPGSLSFSNCVGLAAILILAFSPAPAQVDTGFVTGAVTDPSGNPVPRVSVKITSESTGSALTTETSTAGLYQSPPIRAGWYVVLVEVAGFKSMAKRIRTEISYRSELNFQLELGTVSQSVEVTEAAAVLQSESSTISNLRTEQAIRDLPLNTRNFTQLVNLTAGTMPNATQSQGLAVTNKRGIPEFSINGLPVTENNFLVDGLANYDHHNGGTLLIYPPLEAIAEFRLDTSVASAQYGRGGGGTISVVYKSGGQKVRGGVFNFFRNSALDAKNFFNPPNQKIPAFRQNQFGAFLGGPAIPGQRERKTFFLANYEGQVIRQTQNYISSVPVAAFREGNFSAAPQRIFDPLTQAAGGVRQQFPGNQIPANRLDTVGRNILRLYPLPNLNDGLANNYIHLPVRSTNAHSGDARVDHQFSSSDFSFVRYSVSNFDLKEPSFLPTPAVGGGPGVPGPNQQTVHQGVVSHNHIFSARILNETRLGFTHLKMLASPANAGNDVSRQAGIPGVNVDELTSGLTFISIPGLTSLGDNGFSPALIVDENRQINNNTNVQMGGHSIRFGGGLIRVHYNAFQTSGARGLFNFGTGYTFNPAVPAGTGIAAADALLGKPGSGALQSLNGTRGFRRNEYSSYFQDDWKVNRWLTINAGLRYEVFDGFPWKEVGDRLWNFVLDLQDVARVGTNGLPSGSGVLPDRNNFAPRLGLAAKLAPGTVFRTGYGLFYSVPPVAITNSIGLNPPELISDDFTNDPNDFARARLASQGYSRNSASVRTAGLIGWNPHARSPYVQQWNAALQRQIGRNDAITIGYVGTKGSRLWLNSNLNQPVPGTTPIASRRPFPALQSINYFESRGSSTYHGLQLTYERRFAKSLNFQSAFTYSHAIDEPGSPMDPRNWRRDRGNSNLDVRHRWITSLSYSLPGPSGSGWRARALGGWQVNGILSFYGGLPFSAGSATNTLNTGSGTRADRLGDGNLPASERTPQRWFDLGAFTAPGPQQFGTGGRNVLRGPGTAQADLSLFKNLSLGSDSQRRLQFRAEIFNITNTPQFNNPASNIGAGGVGTITSAGSPITYQRASRQVQLALKLYY
jgi:hypothetical protein